MFYQLRLAEKIIIIYSPKLVIHNSNAYCVYNLLAKSRRWICTIIVLSEKRLYPGRDGAFDSFMQLQNTGINNF
jgi:hypothetical protein